MADLIYVVIPGGFAYVVVILDAWSRRVVGYAIGRSIDAQLALAALTAAFASRSPPAGPKMLRKRIESCWPHTAWLARWDGAAIHMTTPRRKAS